jgi:hypothetical protein
MSERRNLADPAFEPTDADLMELSREAFAGVREARDRTLEELRAKIATLRAQVLRDLDERLARPAK